MAPTQSDRPASSVSRRSLRAVFAADVAGFSGQMSLNETNTVSSITEIQQIGRRQFEKFDGWLFGMAGDGLFATFESAINAVRCAIELQQELATLPQLRDMPLRIGIHVGEVLIKDELPYGETLNIAARLEALADPGGILVSGPVMDAVSARVSATFEARGVPQLKNIPRRIPTFAVKQVLADTPDASSQDPAERAPESPIGPASAEPANAGSSTERSVSGLAGSSTAQRLQKEPDSALTDTSAVGTTQSESPTRAFVEQITKALAAHIGPFAKRIVGGHMAANPSVFELISRLEKEIPNEEERLVFRVRASHINAESSDNDQI